MCQCHEHGPGHGPEQRHPQGHDLHGGCGCGAHGSEFQRRFYGKEEKLGKLEKYLSDLKKEVKAVEELIKEIKEEA